MLWQQITELTRLPAPQNSFSLCSSRLQKPEVYSSTAESQQTLQEKTSCSSFCELSAGNALEKSFQVLNNSSSQENNLFRKHPQLSPANTSRSNVSCSCKTQPVFVYSIRADSLVFHINRNTQHPRLLANTPHSTHHSYTHRLYLHEHHAADLQSEHQE